jgi:hypothetical protein
VPAAQRPVVGALEVSSPFAEPHLPLVDCITALHDAVEDVPAHFHIQFAPDMLSADAVPTLQRFVEGATVNPCPLAEPHVPTVPVVAAEAMIGKDKAAAYTIAKKAVLIWFRDFVTGSFDLVPIADPTNKITRVVCAKNTKNCFLMRY